MGSSMSCTGRVSLYAAALARTQVVLCGRGELTSPAGALSVGRV